MDEAILSYLENVYKKIRLLRQSEKGKIWLAADREGQPVILKRLALTGLPLKELQEAGCPLCPQIIYYSEDDRETIIVEEHIEGKSLDQLTADKKLTEKEATDLLLNVAQGLALLHQKGIIHRDIKPANLLREKSGQIRLIDFDAARLVKEGTDEDTTRLGTKGYAPPEQYGYGQTDARSDLYALGMTVKRLLPENYRGYLLPIIRKCTAVDPDERYQSAEELAQSLKRRLFLSKIKIPLLTALIASLVLFFALALLKQIPQQQEEPIEDPPSITENQPPPVPNNDTKKTEPPQSAQETPASLPAAAEKSPNTTPPTTPLSTPAEAPIITPPAETREAPAPAIPFGILRTTLYWNGNAIDDKAYPAPEISPSQWLSGSAFLHVENDSNTALPASTISLAYTNNYGKKLNDVVHF
ncbi:MAG: serine/threonine protein kinase [Selenomonas sp.]|nr:serine/threonine protein kinase [Selenomonas sp.]